MHRVQLLEVKVTSQVDILSTGKQKSSNRHPVVGMPCAGEAGELSPLTPQLMYRCKEHGARRDVLCDGLHLADLLWRIKI